MNYLKLRLNNDKKFIKIRTLKKVGINIDFSIKIKHNVNLSQTILIVLII
jgi:hypothetical protein